MSNTANYNLKTWATSEITDSFNNFVFGVAGDVNSNMTKIDTQMKSSADGVSTLKNVPIKTVFASRVSDSYYTATVSDYSAYVNGNVFLLMLDTTSHDTLTLNINDLGTLSVMKYKADGNLYNIEAGDILANTVIVIRYDGTRWLVVGSPTTNPSKMFYPDSIYGGILSGDLNSITVSGFYTAYGAATGAPNTSSSWYVQHINSNAGTVSAMQVANSFTTSDVYKRLKTSSVWGSWINVTSSDVVRYTAQTLTVGQKSQARGNIDTNLITYTDASQIGITLSTSTTLEQLANAMPDNSVLNIVPPQDSTTDITPNVTSVTRYGVLQLLRLSASRVTAMWYQKESGNVWANSVFSNDNGVTWATAGWRRLTTVMKTGVTSITIANGQQNASLVITFGSNPAFMAVPMVLPLLNTGYPGGKSVSLDGSVSPSATSFKVDVGLSAVATADTSVTIRWYALEVI